MLCLIMQLARRIVFLGLLITYLIGCPLAVLYVLGYVIVPGTEHGVVKTGLISLATVPSDASIYLEGRRYTKTTPTVLERLYPGTYHVKAALKHYRPWTQTVRVDAGQAAVFEKILLLPDQPAIKVLLPVPLEEMTPLPETRFVILSMGRAIDDLLVYDRDASASWPLLPDPGPWHDSRVLSLLAVKGSPWLLLRVKSQDGEHYLGAALKTGHARVTDLTKLFSVRPQEVIWSASWPHQLFSMQGGSVNHLDLEAAAIYPRVIDRIRGIGVHEQTLYALTEDFALYRVDREGKRLELLFEDPSMAEALSGVSGMFHVTVLSRDLVVLMGARGELWVSRFPARLVGEGMRGFAFDAKRERLLIWDNDRLGLLDCAVGRRQDAAADDAPVLRWIWTEGKDLRQAFWAHDASHIVFQDGETVGLLPLESAGVSAPIPLLRVRAGSAVSYEDDAGGVYYLDRATGALSFLSVVPRTGFQRLLHEPE